MSIILGIDPGSRITGYAVLELTKPRAKYITSGCIRVPESEIAERLQHIHACICEIISHYQPTEAAIEAVFMHRNPNSALKLGQARGAAIVAMGKYGLAVAEYSTRQIKQAVVGYGNASKTQIQHMVKSLLNLSGTPQADAADALAVALCHSHMRSNLTQLVKMKSFRGRRVIEVK